MFDFDATDLLNDQDSNAWDHFEEELRKRSQVHGTRGEMAVATRE